MRHASTSLLTLGLLLLAGPLTAQAVYNDGATLTVSTGATFYVGGGYQQTAGAVLKTEGASRVDGDVQSAGTLDLSTGELEVKGHVTNAGTTTSANAGTLRLTGAANQNVDLNGGTVGRLVVDKTAVGSDTVRLPSDLNVTGQVVLADGMVRTRLTSRVVLPDGATVVGEAAGRYVQGNLVVTRAGVSGSAPVDFQNGVVINPQGNNLGTVEVKRAAGLGVADATYGRNPSNAAYKSIDRIWTIQPQTQPATPAQLTMSWLPDDDNGLTAADFANAAAWKRAGPGAPWVPMSAYQNAVSRSLTVVASAFSDWTVAAQSAPLPVELLAFEVERAGDAARLTWVTASEKDNDYFEVQVSLNGRDYRPLGRVAGQGTTSQRHTYEFVDQKLLSYQADPVYYRLRQVDHDGQAGFSPVRHVRVAWRGELSASAWPNPFDGESGVQLQIRTSADAPVELTLLDAMGRLISRRALHAERGVPVSLPEAARLATGVYMLKVCQGQEQVTIRLTRQ